ncbi:MAG: hypothetical protein HND53_11880 [Proteobacteria bacterium]|nr:hypothetical protein [Pseudomonadota bacterium]NOG61192.1 hypothetical protein [Pseudomonadota bacterium]
MKEAFLMGLMAMGANADNNDINITQVLTPVTVTQEGKNITKYKSDFHYSITAEDTRATSKPQITRHISRTSN